MTATLYFAFWTLGGLRVASSDWGVPGVGCPANQPLDLRLFPALRALFEALGFVASPAPSPPRLRRKRRGGGHV